MTSADGLIVPIGDAMLAFPQPHHMPCVECGASVSRTERELHICSRERRLDFEVFQLREELDQFDEVLMAYLESPRGRFEVWYAAHHR